MDFDFELSPEAKALFNEKVIELPPEYIPIFNPVPHRTKRKTTISIEKDTKIMFFD